MKPPNDHGSESTKARRQFLKALALGGLAAPVASWSWDLAARDAAPNGALCTDPRLLTPETDLSYQGMFRLFPSDGQNTRLGFSYAAMTGRVVNGEIRILITGSWPNGWNEPVYEVAYPGAGPNVNSSPVAPLVRNWGNVYQGHDVNIGDHRYVKGLLWADDMLIWAYGDAYNVAGTHAPSIGASVLNSNGTVQAYGPWRTTAHSQKTRGYLVRHPVTGQVGYGGPITSGNAQSPWGAAVHLGNVPNLSRPADPLYGSAASINTTPFIDHSSDRRQRRFDTNYRLCGWNVQYVASQGGWTQPGPDTFSSIDMISAAAWVHTGNKHGIVCFGQMVQTIPGYAYGGGDSLAHMWYGETTCVHGQIGVGTMATGDAAGSSVMQVWVFDPQNPSVDPRPVPLKNLIPGRNQATNLYQFGGAWFEPQSKLLFVSEILADPTASAFEHQPIVHVFRVT